MGLIPVGDYYSFPCSTLMSCLSIHLSHSGHNFLIIFIRDVFRRLFGEPSEKDAALKVMVDFKEHVTDLFLSCATIFDFLPVSQ